VLKCLIFTAGSLKMNKIFIIISALLMPICASASIDFNITHTTTGAYDGHIVKAPFKVYDEYNHAFVMSVGDSDRLRQGLDSGVTKSAKWKSGWLFHTNISSYYTIYPTCNLDGQIMAYPASHKSIFISDGTKVDIDIECKVTNEGALLPPKTTVRLHKQES
jgi:hypothetical protein